MSALPKLSAALSTEAVLVRTTGLAFFLSALGIPALMASSHRVGSLPRSCIS